MSDQKSVLYITFIDFNSTAMTGSSVRPLRMYDAFIKQNYKVILLSGIGNNRRVRNHNVKEIKAIINKERPDFCYIEPPSGPLFFFSDRSLIRLICKMHIPSAFFYRDLYWKFPAQDFSSIKKYSIVWFKHQLIKMMQKRDFRLIKNNVEQIYFTSACCNNFMQLKNFKLLPPGCVNYEVKKHVFTKTGIYVGGATVRYGLGLVLDSCLKVSEDEEIKLIVVCPQNQWEQWVLEFPQYSNLPDWIEIYHIGDGEQLNDLYNQSDFAFVPILKSSYNDLALPIKLFEYISRLLPVIVTDCDAMKVFLDSKEVGFICEDNIDAYTEALREMLTNISKYNLFKNNIEYIRQDNLWERRVDQIARDLNIRS